MECNPSYTVRIVWKIADTFMCNEGVRVLDVFHTPFIESDIRLRLLSTSITRTFTCW